MTGSLKGGAQLAEFLAALPAKLEQNILRGALRAGATVIADAAKEGCRSEEVRDAIGVTAKSEPGVVSAKVQVKGDGAYIAPWLEFGTDPHFITVDSEQAGGRTARRVNRLGRENVLVINGQFVGETVHHPGAKPYPFMRPAVDSGTGAAISAIGGYITARLTKEALTAPAPAEEPDE